MCGEYGEGRAVVVEGDAAAEGGVGIGVGGEGGCVVSGKGEVLRRNGVRRCDGWRGGSVDVRAKGVEEVDLEDEINPVGQLHCC